MSRQLSKTAAILAVALAAISCGGSGKGETKTAADATVDLSAMDQLKGLSTGLQAQLDALMAPINEVDGLVGDITSMPSRLGVNASSLLSSAKATVDGGQISVSADLNVDAAVKAEIDNVLARLQAVVAGLKAIPSNAQALAAQAGEALLKLPALGTKVSAEANVKIGNPFAKPEEKAQAQADLQSLAQVQADVQGAIQQVQQQIMSIPALATSALAKLSASFAS
jgi:hypothetical protein